MPLILYNSEHVRLISKWGAGEPEAKVRLEKQFLDTEDDVIFSNAACYLDEINLLRAFYISKAGNDFGGFSVHQGGIKTKSGWGPCMLMCAFSEDDHNDLFIETNVHVVAGMCSVGFFDYPFPANYSLLDDVNKWSHVITSDTDIDHVLEWRIKAAKTEGPQGLKDLSGTEFVKVREFLKNGNWTESSIVTAEDIEEVTNAKRLVNLEKLLYYVPKDNRNRIRELYPDGISASFAMIRDVLRDGGARKISIEVLNDIVDAPKK